MPESVVLLHGFSATSHTWDGVLARLDRERYLPLALDLPGHGEARNATRPITFAGCVEQVLAASPERFVLCGYSQGGRIALQVALAAPERVSRLVLVSSTAGIEDPAERAERRRADHRLAADLETTPFEEFVERWRTQPLFRADLPEVGELARADQRRNTPEALAAVLRGIGTGEMEPLWKRLGELKMRVSVVFGERDEKFRALGERMVELLPNAELLAIPGGHSLPWEQPRALARILEGGAPGAGAR